MKVLFISRAKHKNEISPIVLNQGNSLKKNNINVDFFIFKGKGFFGYLTGIINLKKQIKNNQYQVYHAHYLFSGIAASFANAKPLVVSLMGGDVLANLFLSKLSGFYSKHFCDVTIVKSNEMKTKIDNPEVEVIPNGVDLDHFIPLEKQECQLKLQWSGDQTHILFAGDPGQKVKGFELATQAVEGLSYQNIRLHILKGISLENLPTYYNAADVVLLTSSLEGSPNVIKEAMACNCPIVSTDVGDVKEIISGTKGCFVTDHNPIEITEAIEKAIRFGNKTVGCDTIPYLDANRIAKRLISIYNSLN